MLKLIIKRFLLIIIGIVLSLILLEFGLRLAGWTISSYQQYKNNKALKNKTQYTIMCLGESTTQNQYPVQLQEILDNKYPNKFSVIDCGFSAINLETILNFLDTNINKYNPNIAICMMGINDGFSSYNKLNLNLYNKKINLKVYKLLSLIFAHLKDLFIEKVVLANQNTEKNDINSAITKLKEKDFKAAEKILSYILKTNENNEQVYFYLIDLYYYFLDDKDKAYTLALDAINKNITRDRTFFYKIAIKYCISKNDIDKVKLFIKQMIYQEPYSVLNPDMYRFIESFLTEKEKHLLIKKFLEKENFSFLAIKETEVKNYLKAQEYFDKAEEIRLNFPNTETYNLYKLIVKKLIDNNIKVICMQYPIRNILSLQEQLKNESYYNILTFISNEKLFKDALMDKEYNEIFSDQFAGDFGHCTDLGNTMIAENVVNTLEKMLDLKEKSN